MLDKEIDIGQRIKDLLYEKKVSQSELSVKIGRHVQSLNKSLAGNTMKVDLLLEIMNVADIKSWEIFQDGAPTGVVQTGNGNVAGNGNKVTMAAMESDLASCREKVLLLEQLLAEKERVIQLLEKNQ
ncbi:MAG: hypothetical protein SF052_15815 [Bacteroidia bacterium]|nr:hypothetical protein [Bacteroidia bacterium]